MPRGKQNKSRLVLIDKDTLHRMYVDENLSLNEIAKQLNSTRITITKWLVFYDITSRRIEV